jgi:phospholipid/cholesterol/gamma-HCH transport system permease protein
LGKTTTDFKKKHNFALMDKLFFHFGRYWMLMGRIFSKPEKVWMYWRETARQMNDIGVGSLVIVSIIAVFIGAVTAVQFAYQLGSSTIPMYYIGYIVRDSMIIELAPTFSCLALAGKVGSNIAAEIGGMRQKEQIDALEVMGVETASYLIGPKIVAAMVVVPLLVIFAAFMGIVGGYFASISSGFLTTEGFKQGLLFVFNPFNITMMLIKSFVFAYIFTSISSYQGYYATGGSIELGQASTNAVVYSNIMILLADYVLAILLT